MSVSLQDFQRKDLIKKLIESGIKDRRVLDAMNTVKRELFVSPELRRFAYENNALPIGSSQTISQPYTVAFMTEILKVETGDKILEIGTGSGYQAAVLCELGADVYSVERIEQLYKEAGSILKKANYKVSLKCSDGTKGWKDNAPYDGIIVTAGSPGLPEALLKQLGDGGRLVIPVGDRNTQEIWCVTRTKDKNGKEIFTTEKYQYFKFVPLIGEEGWENADGR
ncbi:MAG: protein-L-isoaspartate(D-aspartate) O-methyltransferase [Bacteroidetes bacterium]|nr:protein-L-isoaspartate(D-aspartate) O-methyltransferase [Bacteroidota bacterium]